MQLEKRNRQVFFPFHTVLFIPRILVPVLRVFLSILTLNARSVSLTLGTGVYALKKGTLVNTAKKVYQV